MPLGSAHPSKEQAQRSTKAFPRNFASDVWAAGCGMWDDEFKFVDGEREGQRLLGSFPVRKRGMFDVKCDGVIQLIDGISPKVAIASLDRSFVLVRRALAFVVGCKFGTAIAHDLHRIVAAGVELNWSRLSEQIFRVDKWSLCRG